MGDYGDAFNRNDNSPAAVQARTKAQNRANVMQLKLMGQSHPTGLTTSLLRLFEPRPPLEFKPPPEKRKCPPYTGMAQFVGNFAEKGDPEYQPPVQKGETPVEKRARIHNLRLEEGAKKVAEELEKYDPNNDPNISGDPYKTLFVARLNYETSESKVKREFEAYGPIKRVRLVTDKETNKPRGYAFIEYMHTRDMKAAYKQADGKKLDNRRVLVDVERGRTVPNWRPRRLGGGLGTTRVGGEDLNQKHSGREIQQPGGPSRSEEPRVREERQGDREREKSRERGREQEKSRERSHDRPRDRDHREDRHHRDRDRNRERDRERDRGRDRERGRDRDRDRDRVRDRGSGRDYDRDRERDRDRDRPRERDRERDRNREKDYEIGEGEHDRGRSRDKDYDYDRVESKHEQDRHGVERERNYDPLEPEEDDPEWYQQHRDHGHRRSEAEHDDHDRQYEFYKHQQDRGKYDNLDVKEAAVDHHHYDNADRDRDQYDQMEEDNYPNDRATSEQREKERSRASEREYVRSERSLSREYEY